MIHASCSDFNATSYDGLCVRLYYYPRQRLQNSKRIACFPSSRSNAVGYEHTVVEVVK